MGFVTIRDEIRTSAAETIGYFNEQGVTLNVISGDDPRTVSSIARVVGVPGADAYVDATTLDTPAKLDAAVDRYHVFGRVTPQQKRELVQALKRREHTVAMTGDSVNDVLALKEADCSVTMAAGSDAARNVAGSYSSTTTLPRCPPWWPRAVAPSTTCSVRPRCSCSRRCSRWGWRRCALRCRRTPSSHQMTLINFFCIGAPGLCVARSPTMLA
ncbi:MAG: HAD family hydrolase [Collinsella sp.]